MNWLKVKFFSVSVFFNYIQVTPYVYQMPCKKISSSFGIFCTCLQSINWAFFDFPKNLRKFGSINFNSKQTNWISFISLQFDTWQCVLFSIRYGEFHTPGKNHNWPKQCLRLLSHWSANWIWMMRFSYEVGEWSLWEVCY